MNNATSGSLDELCHLLSGIAPRVIACSGGIDSLLLATLAHRVSSNDTLVAHAVSPAVPAVATERVKEQASREGWNLQFVETGEFESEAYLSNPVNRCYHCKSNLYNSLEQIKVQMTSGVTVLSGANFDDLGDYRPGLIAAAEYQVRHPYVELSIGKDVIRDIARLLDLPFAELPASPCLASRLYTGTRVTAARLRAIEDGEALIRNSTGIGVVRCRLREDHMIVEVGAKDSGLITPSLLDAVSAVARASVPSISTVRLDPAPYRAGRAVAVLQ